MITVKIESGKRLGINLKTQLINIFSTPKGTVPYMRDFGIGTEAVDMPPEAAANVLAAEMAEACEKWEPSVIVKRVTPNYDQCAQGRLSLTVEVEEK